jgi:hypothetical protein
MRNIVAVSLSLLIHLCAFGQEPVDSLNQLKTLDDRFDSLTTELERIRIEKAENRFSAAQNTAGWGNGWFLSAKLPQMDIGAGRSFRLTNDWHLRMGMNLDLWISPSEKSVQPNLRATIATPVMHDIIGMSAFLEAGELIQKLPLSGNQRSFHPAVGIGFNVEMWFSKRTCTFIGSSITYYSSRYIQYIDRDQYQELRSSFFETTPIMFGITWFAVDHSGPSAPKRR